MTIAECMMILLVVAANAIIFYAIVVDRLFLFGAGLFLFFNAAMYAITHQEKMTQIMNIKLF